MHKILDKLNGILRKDLPIKGIAIIFTGIFLLSLLPIFRIAYYAHPFADDFTYGLHAHQTFEATKSIIQTMIVAAQTAKDTYFTWQGTFSSVFLMALNPAVFQESIYWITPFLILGMLCLGILIFLRVLLTEVFSFDKWTSYIFSLLVLTASIQNFYWPAQGIYWYNSSIHYTFMYGSMLLMLAIQIHSFFIVKTWRFVVAMFASTFLAILCGGGNFPVSMVCVLLNCCVFLYGVFTRKRRVLWTLIPITINVIAFFANILAPGNTVRKAFFVQMAPMNAIKAAIEYMFVAQYKWFTITILLLTIIAIPVSWKMVEKTKFSFKWPGVILVFSFLCCAAMVTPSYYATSEEPLARVINVIRLMYHLLLFINIFYFTGWIRNKKNMKCNPRLSIALLFLVFVLGVMDYHTTEIPQREYITYGAYCSYITGEAQIFHQEYLDRKVLLNSGQNEVQLSPFSVHPFPFWTYDISEDAGDWKNGAIAAWYQKQSVTLK